MPIYAARGGFLSTADWEDLAKKIVDGDGYGWPGDVRMELKIGVLKNRETGKEGHRLEVWRHNEDGSETMIGHWLPREQMMVCYDLARMRVDSPAYESVEDRIDRHNAAIEEERSRQFRDSMGELLEHALHLAHDRSQPKNTFYGMGRGDKPLNVQGASQPAPASEG